MYGSRAEAAAQAGIGGGHERAFEARQLIPILNVSNLAGSFAWFALASTSAIIMRRVAECSEEMEPDFGGAWQAAVAHKSGAPQVLAQRREQIGEGHSRLGGIPRADQPTEGATLLEVGSRPQQHQAIDQSGEWSGTSDRPRGLVLGVTARPYSTSGSAVQWRRWAISC